MKERKNENKANKTVRKANCSVLIFSPKRIIMPMGKCCRLLISSTAIFTYPLCLIDLLSQRSLELAIQLLTFLLCLMSLTFFKEKHDTKKTYHGPLFFLLC